MAAVGASALRRKEFFDAYDGLEACKGTHQSHSRQEVGRSIG